ncbi:nucleotide cyclase [Haematococcus lacustris]
MRRTAALVLLGMLTAGMSVLADNCTEPVADSSCLALLGKSLDGLRIANVPSLGAVEYNNLTRLLYGCLGIPSQSLRPLRILSPIQNLNILPGLVSQWTNITGYSLIVDYAEIPDLPGLVLDTASNGQRSYDGWILDPVMTVDMVQAGMVEPLDTYIAADASLNWPDFIRYFRQVSSVYNGTVTGMPLAGKVSTLYYRKDVFAMANLSPPSTWDEFLTIARAMNGSDFNADGVPDYSICWQVINCLEDTVVFSQLLTPMIQALGTKSGWMFDPVSMTPLVNNEAMLKALSLYKELLSYTVPLPRGAQCMLAHMPFLQGSCLMTIKWDEQFKGIQLLDKLLGLPANPWHGKIGFAQLPGSPTILNRSTGKLEACTTTTCPHATLQRNQFTGETSLVNTAPNFGIAGFSGMINAHQGAGYKQATFNFFSFIAQLNRSMVHVIGNSPVGPFLTQHLSSAPSALARWQAAGYHPPDVVTFLDNMDKSLTHPNGALDIRITNGRLYREAFSTGLAMFQNGSTAADVMVWINAQFDAQLAKDGGRMQVQAGYLAGLNTKLPLPPPAPPPPPRPASNSPDLTAPIVVPVTVCGVLLLVAILVVLARRSGFAARLFGKSIAPRLGPCVTLLVTDIQDSTTLWETLSQDSMNEAVELHHSLARKLLAGHSGYESATEGDAFIMAFHTASDALHWARDFQEGLLHLAWPEQLLQLEAGAPVWAVPGANQDTLMLKQYSIANFDTTLGSGTNLPMVDFSNDPNRQESHPWKLAVAARTFYVRQWIAVPAQAGSRACLVFRGLRVRVGLHSGVNEAADAVFNKTTGRMQYGGRPLAMAKAVGDVGQGGMVLLSQAAFEQLPVSKLASFGLLLNMGDYVFTKDESLPATPIYQAFGRGLEQRTAFLQGPLRASQQLQAGVLDAPLGDVSIAFANMVGVGTLMAWDKTLASTALDLYHIHAINALQAVPQLLRKLPGNDGDAPALLPAGSADLGYLVELSGGLCLAAFLSPAAALLWALQLWADLLGAPWQEELLAHVLCEEVAVAQTLELLPEDQSFTANTGFEVAGRKPPGKSSSCRSLSSGPRPLRLLPSTNEVMSVLFRGPRLKVGVDVGRVHADVNPVTGRMTYRGRVMNRAARIADKAHSGSVWCSHAAWDWCCQACPELMQQLDVKGHSMGQHSLKGVTESMHLDSWRSPGGPCKRCSSGPPLPLHAPRAPQGGGMMQPQSRHQVLRACWRLG